MIFYYKCCVFPHWGLVFSEYLWCSYVMYPGLIYSNPLNCILNSSDNLKIQADLSYK